MHSKLLVVTDLGLFKAYSLSHTLKGTPHLELVEETILEQAHQKLTQNTSDQAGRRAAPTRGNWGAPMADDHNLRLENRRRLIRQIGNRLEQLLRRTNHDGCWLAADPELSRNILAELPAAMRPRVERAIAYNLAKASQVDLLAHFLGTPPTAARL